MHGRPTTAGTSGGVSLKAGQELMDEGWTESVAWEGAESRV